MVVGLRARVGVGGHVGAKKYTKLAVKQLSVLFRGLGKNSYNPSVGLLPRLNAYLGRLILHW